MFIRQDNQDYKELLDAIPSAAVVTGQAEQYQDVFGFWLYDNDSGEETTFITECRQVLADKLSGTGESISSGERVYAVVAEDFYVTANPTGTAGTDYYYCGIARETRTADQTQILIEFDGTRWDENI